MGKPADLPNTLDDARALVLEVLQRQASARGTFDMGSLVEEAFQEQMRMRREILHEDILTAAYDLFLTGVVSWGFDRANTHYPKAHLTRRGRAVVNDRARDPSNPAGYLAGLRPLLENGVAWSYVEEAVATYQARCARATAVMVGAAAEALVLELRDDVRVAYDAAGAKPPKGLLDWKVKSVLDAIEETVRQDRLGAMPRDLRERFDAYWSAFAHRIRFARNDAGHPSSLTVVDMDTAHASLLMLPALARLVADLREWVRPAPAP